EADGHLAYLEIGSASLAPERYQQLQTLVPRTPIDLPYGLTEARVGYLQRGSRGLLNRLAAISPGLEVEVVASTGDGVTPGQTGEIKIRGKGLMAGYWNAPLESQQALRDGGFRTGDAGLLNEEGEVELLGRIDQILKVGGRKVSPDEIENVLNLHDKIA